MHHENTKTSAEARCNVSKDYSGKRVMGSTQMQSRGSVMDIAIVKLQATVGMSGPRR